MLTRTLENLDFADELCLLNHKLTHVLERKALRSAGARAEDKDQHLRKEKLTRVFLQSVLISSHHDGRKEFNSNTIRGMIWSRNIAYPLSKEKAIITRMAVKWKGKEKGRRVETKELESNWKT